MAVVFVDFEASSLGRHGTPVEVAWAFESGEGESYLIRPAPGWTDWAASAQAVHGLPRDLLLAEGTPHDAVARRMVEALDGHALHASAPSWDGKWLSALLRAANLPRHALRLGDADDVHRRAIRAVLEAGGGARVEGARVEAVLQAGKRAVEAAGAPAHRALGDARREWDVWRAVRRLAEAGLSADPGSATTGSP